MGQKRRIYVPPITGQYAPEDQILARAREYFLIMIQSVTPKPLYFLRDEVSPKYRAAFAQHNERGKSDDEVKVLSCQAFVDAVIGDEAERVRSSREFQDAKHASLGLIDAAAALLAWSKRFNLQGKDAKIDQNADSNALERARVDAVWPLLAGLETILHWHFEPAGWLWEKRNPPGWRPPVRLFKESPTPPEKLPPIQLRIAVPWQPTTDEERAAINALQKKFTRRFKKSFRVEDIAMRADQMDKLLDDLRSEMQRYPPTQEIDAYDWFVGVETESDFKGRMRISFEEWLARHIAAQKESAHCQGLIDVPATRDREHFEWAAKYQVDSMSASSIVKDCKKKNLHISESTVEEEIGKVLKSIRLRRRPGKRGPKPKV